MLDHLPVTGGTDTDLTSDDGRDRGVGRGRGARARDHGALLLWVAVLVVGVVASRLPLFGRPVSRDEAGFLMVASQLGPGRSLYGDHWVDRPPLLLGFYAVADWLGGPDALRSLGLLLVAGAVVAAALLGWAAGAGQVRTRVAVVCAATAAVFLATPLFGTYEVNGELIAAPLVLTGFALVLAAVRAGAPGRRAGLLLAAGLVGAAAVLVKQNQWDVFVLLAALLLAGRRSDGRPRLAPHDAWPFLGGAGLALVAALAGAARIGTTPVELWDAVVVFRVQAAAVIGSSATAATGDRLVDLVVAFVLSGAPLVLGLLVLVLALRRSPGPGAVDLRLAAVAVLAWESFAVLGGASYWPHYLICFVPGLVLAMAVVGTRRAGDRRAGDRRVGVATGVVLAWAAVAGTVSLASTVVDPPARPQDELIAWLQVNTEAGDDAVVAYGYPDILHGAGLRSPYPDLWSLPVRVRDPQLQDLGRLLSGPRAPDWVVLTAPTLATWGIDPRAGSQALEEHYVEEAEVGRYTVYRLAADD